MVSTNRSSGLGELAALALVIFVAAGCGSSPQQASEEAFWAQVRLGGADEVEGYATLAEMTSKADLVVLGTFASVQLSRTIQGDAPQDQVAYALVTVDVAEAANGSEAPSTLPLEFLLPDPSDPSEQVERMSEHLPKGQVVMMLRAKTGDGESGLYRLVNSYGLFAATGRSVLDTPLAEATPASVGLYAAELGSIESLAELWVAVKN